MLGLGALGQFPLGGGPTNPVVVVDNFFSPLSEPVRYKLKQRHAVLMNHQTTAFSPLPIVSFSYYQPLSEPKRFKRALPAPDHQVLAFQPKPIIDVSWFDSLSEPVRVKRRLKEGSQLFLTAENVIPSVSFAWIFGLSEPIRIKQGIRKDLQPTLGRGEFVPTNFTLQLQATEQHDIFLAVVYQFNIPVGASVSIIVRSP